MKNKYTFTVLIFILAVGFSLNAQVPARVGWWRFDNKSTPLKASIGQDLTQEGTIEVCDGPVTGNNGVKVGVGSYLVMVHNIGSNGGGERTNEWTLQVDFRIPESDIWHSFFQINTNNSDDGDLFINPTLHVGVWEASYSDTVVELDTWYRMVLTVSNGNFFRIYLNGDTVVDAPGRDIDSRYAIGDSLLMFADNDGEDGEIWCSEIGMWDVALTPEEVKTLGDATNSPTSILNRPQSGNSSELGQNYPNPFRNSTTFPYEINKTSVASFRILDLTGKEIQTINEGVKAPGKYFLQYNSENLKPGMYYFQMITDEKTSVRKVVIK
jgi:hypothetical protein